MKIFFLIIPCFYPALLFAQEKIEYTFFNIQCVEMAFGVTTNDIGILNFEFVLYNGTNDTLVLDTIFDNYLSHSEMNTSIKTLNIGVYPDISISFIPKLLAPKEFYSYSFPNRIEAHKLSFSFIFGCSTKQEKCIHCSTFGEYKCLRKMHLEITPMDTNSIFFYFMGMGIKKEDSFYVDAKSIMELSESERADLNINFMRKRLEKKSDFTIPIWCK